MRFAKDDPLPTKEEIAAKLAAVIKLSAETDETKKKRVVKPYYNETRAFDVAKLLDRLHRDKVPLRVSAQDFTIGTLKLQYYQGLEYLCDHDESGKYAALRDITVCRSYADYYELHIRERRIPTVELATQSAQWKEEFITFLDCSQVGEKFHRIDVTLTDEDIAWGHAQIADVFRIFPGKFEKHLVLCVHLSPEEVDENNTGSDENNQGGSDLPTGDAGEET